VIGSGRFPERSGSVALRTADDAPFFGVIVVRDAMVRQAIFDRVWFHRVRNFVTEPQRGRLAAAAGRT
jgi:hypothetical protein